MKFKHKEGSDDEITSITLTTFFDGKLEMEQAGEEFTILLNK